jgi:hypothetical protein
MEVVVNDIIGDATEITYFVENLTITGKLGHPDRGIIAHDFFWNLSQLNDIQRAATIQGNWFWYFESDFKKQDFMKSQSFKGTIDSVVSSLVSKYNFSDDNKKSNGVTTSQYIEKTANEDFWYQDSIGDHEFIKRLATYAYAPKYKSSPFLSFFNLKGEFYFWPFAKFFERESIAEYSLNASYGEEKFVQEYSIQFGGSDFNRPNYNVSFYSIEQDASNSQTTKTLNSQAISSSDRGIQKSKLRVPIRRNDLKKPQRMRMFGIKGNQDVPSYNGWMNSQFIDTPSSYRMTLTVPFNPELVTGRLVTTVVEGKFSVDKQFATEYMGKWLIMESQHIFNPMLVEQGPNVPYTKVTLIKPSINVWEGHRFVEDFVSA